MTRDNEKIANGEVWYHILVERKSEVQILFSGFKHLFVHNLRSYTLWLRTSRKVNGYMQVRILLGARQLAQL